MIIAGLVALVVVGPALAVHGLAWLARGHRRPAPPRPGGPGAGDVAILLVAHDDEDRILDALAAARAVVPASNVHLVSNGSTDGTADLAHRLGAQVVETFGTLPPAGAAAAGVHAFHLLDRFAHVLVLDVHTRLAPGHLDRALPLFADPSVAAVDARVAPDWLPPRRILAAYRARRHVLAQSFGRDRGGPPATVAHGLPAVGRVYRSAVLADLELDPPGLAEPDLDLTLQLHRRGLGRVALCPGPPAVVATSLRLREHVRLTGRAVVGLRQAAGRGPVGAVLAAQLLERLLAAVVIALVPLAVVLLALAGWDRPAPVGPLQLALGLVLADYLLTIAAALATRQPRYLLAGPLFPLLRVVDATTVLRSAFRRRPATAVTVGRAPEVPRPRRAPDSPRPARARGPRRWPVPAAWALLVAVAAAAVARVALAVPALPASAAEVTLAQAGYARFAGVGAEVTDRLPAVPGTLAATDRQLAAYAWLTGPFERHGSVLASARELSVVAFAVLLAGLVLLTVALRLHPVVTAAAIAVVAAAGPAVAVLGVAGPGVVAAAWLAAAGTGAAWLARALARDALPQLVLAGAVTLGAGLAAAATAPLLIIPAGVAVATWLWFLDAERDEPDTTWRGHALVVLFATGVIATLLWRAGLMLGPPGALGGYQRSALLAAVTVAAGGGLVVARIRPVATGTLTGVGLAVGFGARADVLLPVLVAAAALVAAMLLDAAVRSPAPRVAGGLAGALTAAAAVAGLLIAPPAAPRAGHAALADWVTGQLDTAGTLTVAPDVWADLHRDLTGRQPHPMVRPAGDEPAEGLVVVRGPATGGHLLARFGSLTLLTTRLDESYLDPAPRAAPGAQLARNPRLTAGAPVRAALRAGRVDMRAMAVLAGLCADFDVTLVRTGNSPHERGSGLPDRTLVVSTSDTAALLDWLAAQEPPFAPATVRRVPDGVAIGWRLPRLLEGATG